MKYIGNVSLLRKFDHKFVQGRQCIIFPGFDFYGRNVMAAAYLAFGNQEIYLHPGGTVIAGGI